MLLTHSVTQSMTTTEWLLSVLTKASFRSAGTSTGDSSVVHIAERSARCAAILRVISSSNACAVATNSADGPVDAGVINDSASASARALFPERTPPSKSVTRGRALADIHRLRNANQR